MKKIVDYSLVALPMIGGLLVFTGFNMLGVRIFLIMGCLVGAIIAMNRIP